RILSGLIRTTSSNCSVNEPEGVTRYFFALFFLKEMPGFADRNLRLVCSARYQCPEKSISPGRNRIAVAEHYHGRLVPLLQSLFRLSHLLRSILPRLDGDKARKHRCAYFISGVWKRRVIRGDHLISY